MRPTSASPHSGRSSIRRRRRRQPREDGEDDDDRIVAESEKEKIGHSLHGLEAKPVLAARRLGDAGHAVDDPQHLAGQDQRTDGEKCDRGLSHALEEGGDEENEDRAPPGENAVVVEHAQDEGRKPHPEDETRLKPFAGIYPAQQLDEEEVEQRRRGKGEEVDPPLRDVVPCEARGQQQEPEGQPCSAHPGERPRIGHCDAEHTDADEVERAQRDGTVAEQSHPIVDQGVKERRRAVGRDPLGQDVKERSMGQ
jgi:hypothetical protein